jgi:site-specific DNA-methyltransferase (adenine-specific)
MRDLPDKSVDAVITDPPWMDYVTGMYDASSWHKPIVKIVPSAYAKDLFRVLRPNSAALIWCRWDVFEDHAKAMTSAGFEVRNQIVWAKPNHTAGDLDGNIGNKHECAVFATKGKWQRHSSREVNLWNMPHLFSRDKRDHPTEKPIFLMERSVRLCCPVGGIVLDPFAGSGTTAVACIKTGRNFIGMEIDPTYHAIATKRIEDAMAQPFLLDINGG